MKPKKIMKVGVIGAGYWGPNIIKTFSQLEDCVVKTVADLKEGRREYIKSQYPEINLTGNFNDILGDEEIDAVAIVTSLDTHEEIAIKALDHGKHVFVEKPLSGSTKSAERISKYAEHKGLVLLVGHVFVYHPAINLIKKVISEQQYGNIYYVDSCWANSRPPAFKGNVVWDLAPHELSIIIYILGKNPISVTAFGRAFEKNNYEDVVYIKLFFEGNIFVNIHLNWHAPDKVRSLNLYCSKGMISFDDTEKDYKVKGWDPPLDNRIKSNEKESNKLTYSVGNVWKPSLSNDLPLSRELMHFLKCVRGEEKPLTDGASATMVVQTIEAIDRSISQNGKEILIV